ncbi:MAG: recombinase family protein [Eubacteriales bacterium]|nr:recombinase family protein [Eubacteriales bacterium]
MKIHKIKPLPPPPKRKKVGAYARVSSGKETMLHSLSAQVSYYSNLISKHKEWEYVGVFADEAYTGTKENRPGFQEMLDKCRAGEIEMIITKSISRLARNTVTTLESVRELKALGVDIFFEEENIYSLSAEGEFLLTLLASYAQEESRSASENVKWRIRKDFRDGKVSSMKMLGYHLVDGKLLIIPDEADVVKALFNDYLSGMGIVAICKKYRGQGIKISTSGLSKLLRNEKYTGSLLLQKSFVDNHITKRLVKNVGQLPQYHVKNSHEPIIDKVTFDAVQAEIKRRAKAHKPLQSTGNYTYTGLIRCGKCGSYYRRKHNNAGTKYEKIVWICETFNTYGKAECASQQIPEDILDRIVADVGGLDIIEKITVPEHNILHFRLKNGDATVIEWQNPSRREAWTPEMREAARQKRYEQERVKQNGE